MIKALIIDVDGVIVGKNQGINFPLPSVSVISALRSLNKKGIPIVLCTAKFNHSVKEIITQADLRNPHITDGGALIIDPLGNKIVAQHVFDKMLAHELVSEAISHGFYTEVYGADEYYLQEDHINELTEIRMRILQRKHIQFASLLHKLDDIEVIKIIVFAHTPHEKEQIDTIINKFGKNIHAIWSTHPAMRPTEGIIITVQGVSKKSAAHEVLQHLNIMPSETLGVGDLISDWNFMSFCKYVGVMGNASLELKEKAKIKGEGNYFYAPSADEDGFLRIVDYFFA